MWQRLREYWIPKVLFTATVLVGVALVGIVALMPFVVERLPWQHALITLFAEDTIVRRSTIAAAVGLMITAFVFFRPKKAAPEQQRSGRKPSQEPMAGA